MDLFLDTANVNHIRRFAQMGVIDGVTTNPALIAKEGKNFKKVVNEICSIVDGPVSAEVISTDTAGMIKEASDPGNDSWSPNLKLCKYPASCKICYKG